jgi:acyl carrier protein
MNVAINDILMVIQEAKVVDNPSSLRSDIKLSEQGIDSLGVFNILFLLDEKYNIEIPDIDIEHLTTIEAIVAYLNKRLSV